MDYCTLYTIIQYVINVTKGKTVNDCAIILLTSHKLIVFHSL